MAYLQPWSYYTLRLEISNPYVSSSKDHALCAGPSCLSIPEGELGLEQ